LGGGTENTYDGLCRSGADHDGIGFIGAGTILFLRQEVIRGLTTAAGLWTVAGIGLATGGGMYFAACITTIIVIIILWLLKPLERMMFKRYRIHTMRMFAETGNDPGVLAAIKDLLSAEGIELYNLSIEKRDAGSVIYIKFSNLRETGHIMAIITKLQSIAAVKEVNWDRGN
jgi:putative Mg2+ transporter-C (MgtC) family protein